MAREQRCDVDYFPHECIHGRKMHIIESRYGNDGYATWFKLLEMLGKANNHYIDISDEMTLMFVVSTFKITEEKTIQILDDLSKLGAIDKFLYETYRIIWSQKFVNSISDVYRKRKLKLFSKNDIISEINKKTTNPTEIDGSLEPKPEENEVFKAIIPETIPKVKNSIVENSIVEETKENETKEEFLLEKETKKESSFNFKKALINYGFEEKLVTEWLLVRKTKKATNTETAFNAFINEIESRSSNINDMLQICVTNSWSSFKYLWVDNLNKTQNDSRATKSNSEIFNNAITSEAGRNFNWGKE